MAASRGAAPLIVRLSANHLYVRGVSRVKAGRGAKRSLHPVIHPNVPRSDTPKSRSFSPSYFSRWITCSHSVSFGYTEILLWGQQHRLRTLP